MAEYGRLGAEGARGKTRPRSQTLLPKSLETNRVVRGREKERRNEDGRATGNKGRKEGREVVLSLVGRDGEVVQEGLSGSVLEGRKVGRGETGWLH